MKSDMQCGFWLITLLEYFKSFFESFHYETGSYMITACPMVHVYYMAYLKFDDFTICVIS